MTLDLTPRQHQELVLMTGSRKEWATYLGLPEQEAKSVWERLNLKTPAQHFRSLPDDHVLEQIAKHGSVAKFATHLGVSESFVKSELKIRNPKVFIQRDPAYELPEFVELFEKFRSVTLVSRLTGFTETQIRKHAEKLDLELSTIIDYSYGGNSNAKGRRAELEWAEREGDKIIADRNVLDGSQAAYDFDHKDLGRVNVKSSRQFKFKAKTRKADPFFWKISTNGREKCDTFVCMLYDANMNILLGMKVLPTSQIQPSSSLVLYQRDFDGILPGEVSQ